MSTIADFLPPVLFKAQHVHESNVQFAVREAIIEFMRRTHLAVDEFYADVPCGETEVLLDLPKCRRLLSPEAVYVAPYAYYKGHWTQDWEEIQRTQVDNSWGWYRDDSSDAHNTVQIPGIAGRATRVCIRYAWCIGRGECFVPDWVYDDYADTITLGALAYLHTNPTDEQADMRYGAAARVAFETAIDSAIASKKRARSMFAGRVSVASFFKG